MSTLLRAALIGSTLVDGSMHAASPYLDRVLRTRYAREVDELNDAVRDPPAPIGG